MQKRLAFLALWLPSVLIAGNPDRGHVIVQNQGCLECHTVNGTGAGHEPVIFAPDLASRLASTYTPSALASAMWNHTPAMWSALFRTPMTLPATTERDWEDVFAYLYSLQFFEHAPQLRRGKDVLEQKCGGCHSESGFGPAPTKWRDIDDPVVLVYEMWNHSPEMSRTAREHGKEWPRLNSRDILDLTAYLQYLRNEAPNRQLNLPPAAEGSAPFAQYCGWCHTGPRHSLDTRLRNRTWMDIGAGMWNHAPDMRGVTYVPLEDMRKILAYVWDLQYRGAPGNVQQGSRTFTVKRCINCHKDATTLQPRSPRPGETFTGFSMVALSWGRGREMHRSMETEGIRWPSLSPREMNNLVAFLNSISR